MNPVTPLDRLDRDSRPLLITGASGQLGRALLAGPVPASSAIVGLKRNDFDLAWSAEEIFKKLDELKPRVIFNTAAYTKVDLAEKETALAQQLNATAPAIMAQWCAENECALIHYSTDYVYDGSGALPRSENAETSPLNVYGASKLAGDLAVQKNCPRSLIFRTSWVYDSSGKNFLNTMLRLGSEREEVSIVDDQIGAPTFAGELARISWNALLQALESESQWGLYNACNEGETSWYGFAEEIFKNFRERQKVVSTTRTNDIDKQVGSSGMKLKNLKKISTQDFPTPATRPLNSRLDLSLLKKTFDIRPPHWKESLKTCMTEKYENHTS